MKLALVSPMIDDKAVTPPLNLAVLAAYVRSAQPDLEVRIFDATVDENAYAKLSDFVPDIVGATATTPQIKETYHLLKKMKTEFSSVFTVIGGVHASALPEEASKYADCVVVGDGEIALSNIINCVASGKPVAKIMFGSEIENLDSLPFPAFDLLDMNQYMYRKVCSAPNLDKFPLVTLVTSRGCRHKCPFCWNSKRRTKVRYHSATYLLKEILMLQEKYRIKSIWFNDDEFLENRIRFEAFISGFKQLGLHQAISWACCSRVTSIHSGIPKLLKAAGCVCVFFGIESAAPKSLAFLKCGTVSVGDVENAVKLCYDAKLPVFGTFIFGSLNESIVEMEQTWDWIVKHRKKGLTYANFGVLAPYPGSVLYNYALMHNIFTQDNVEYNKISVSSSIEGNYILDKAISVADFAAFLKDKVDLVWVEVQVRERNFRGILTPTFLHTLLKHPLTMWRMSIGLW
ncbi:MAG: radical SAM protein [Candidatus Bathyarchaeia archaeon]